MMEQRYRHMVEQVNMDKDFEADLLERIREGRPKRRPRPLRTALIAACVCLVLTGTAWAVSSGLLLRFIQGDEGLGNFEDTVDYEVAGYYEVIADQRFALDAFSEEMLAATSQEKDGYLGFDSWEAAEEFLGFNVLDNTVLRGMPMTRRMADGASGNCLIHYFNDPDSGDLSVVRLHADYRLSTQVMVAEKTENMYTLIDTVSVMVTMVTEGNPYSNGGTRFFPYDEEDLYQVSVEEYTTSSGKAATILRDPTKEMKLLEATPEEQAIWEKAYSDVVFYTAYLNLGGAVVEVEVHTSETLDEAQCLATLKEVLDAFE